MPISSGTRLGPYEILTPLGAGGMGEVYRRLRSLEDPPFGRRATARPDADSTAGLIFSPRSGCRSASRFDRLLRETSSRGERR